MKGMMQQENKISSDRGITEILEITTTVTHMERSIRDQILQRAHQIQIFKKVHLPEFNCLDGEVT